MQGKQNLEHTLCILHLEDYISIKEEYLHCIAKFKHLHCTE